MALYDFRLAISYHTDDWFTKKSCPTSRVCISRHIHSLTEHVTLVAITGTIIPDALSLSQVTSAHLKIECL